MKSPSFVLVLLFFIISLMPACGGNYEEAESDCPCPPVIPAVNPQSYYTVLADENLQEGHKVAILTALNEWAEKTNQTLSYKLSFVDMSQDPPSLNSHTIKIYVKDPGPGYLGWTTWSAQEYSAYTLVRPSIDDDLFRRIMLHELGHAFNLSFNGNPHYEGPYESVMHPSIGDDSSHICCPELQAFCNEFGCQVDCTNSLKPTDNAGLSDIPWKETEVSGH
jgi:hypothetical protein